MGGEQIRLSARGADALREPQILGRPAAPTLPERSLAIILVDISIVAIRGRRMAVRRIATLPNILHPSGNGDDRSHHRPIKHVTGPDGSPLTISDLPSPTTSRWVIRRKAEIVAAVRGGLLSLEQACARYTLTAEEFLSWQSSIEQYGLPGLRSTRIQQYRKVTDDGD